MKEFLQIHPADTVAVALTDRPGIPAGHKFALRDIAEGENVIKYGNPIGHATRPIRKGELVDHHNLATNLCGTLDYSGITLKETDSPPALPVREGAITNDSEGISACQIHSAPSLTGRAGGESSFMGYPRPDGQVGIRNDIWVIPTVGCVNNICQRIAEKAGRGTAILHFSHPYGCSQLGGI